ncbi:MAG: alpha-mannosidase [Candidatus Aminicenantia bacterium]
MQLKFRNFISIGFSILFSLSLYGSDVDSLIERIQTITDFSVKDWFFTKEKIEDPSMIKNFSDWKPLEFGENLNGNFVWLVGKTKLPQKFLGYKIDGRKLFFKIILDDAGEVWINGKSYGRFEWEGRFPLTESAKEGEDFLIVIKGINYGGPLRLLNASIELEETKETLDKISGIILSLRTAKKLLSFDTYQKIAWISYDPKIDNSKVPKERRTKLQKILNENTSLIDIRALESGEHDKFFTSFDKYLKKIKPVSNFLKEFTLELLGNTHIDAAWLWRKSETIEVCKNTFKNAIELMEKYPDFKFSQSSSQYYEWMEELYPKTFEEIKKAVKNGNWEIVGGMVIEPDCNLINGESWARHLLYGKSYFRDKFNIEVKIGWNPDSFGYNWSIPQIYKNAGIYAFITQKISWNDTNVFPYRVFWWEGSDGSRILVYFPFSYVYDFKDPFRLIDQLRQFEANTGFRNMLVLYGVGDHGGGPSEEMLKVIENLKSLPLFPKLKYSTAKDYIENFLLKQDLSKLPVWKDELYLEYHRGTYTTQAEIKEYNRKLENTLVNAEKFALISNIFGGEYRTEALKKAWKIVLFNQFHDILPGSSIREVYVDAKKDYSIAEKITENELKEALRFISSNIKTENLDGEPVVVFNPSPWKRKDYVRVELRNPDEFIITDTGGEEIPSQIIDLTEEFPDEIKKKALLFIAEDVPAMGYKVYLLKKGKRKEIQEKVENSLTIENEFYRVEFDEKRGVIKNIYDKKLSREVLSGSGNLLQLFGDKPPYWDAWDIGYTGEEWSPNFRKIELIEKGPVRYCVRAYFDFINPKSKAKRLNAEPTKGYPNSFFILDTFLYKGIERVEFRTKVDWWEEHTLLKTSFDVNVKSKKVSYEIPFGSIERPATFENDWEKARYEVPALTWVDFHQNDFGVSLVTRSKYGYDVHGNSMRITLLRSPKDPDPTADRGEHEIEYALLSHKNCWRVGNIPRKSFDYNNPLIPIIESKHDGNLSLENSFLEIEPKNVILSCFKKSEKDDSVILRVYEIFGEDTEAKILLPFEPKNVWISNFLEEISKKVKFEGRNLKMNIPKNKVITLKIER